MEAGARVACRIGCGGSPDPVRESRRLASVGCRDGIHNLRRQLDCIANWHPVHKQGGNFGVDWQGSPDRGFFAGKTLGHVLGRQGKRCVAGKGGAYVGQLLGQDVRVIECRDLEVQIPSYTEDLGWRYQATRVACVVAGQPEGSSARAGQVAADKEPGGHSDTVFTNHQEVYRLQSVSIKVRTYKGKLGSVGGSRNCPVVRILERTQGGLPGCTQVGLGKQGRLPVWRQLSRCH
jgi:hypothetical protein